MRLPRHSTAVAYLALFTALGGTSYAAIKLPANSVGSREIKPRSVRTSDLALNARVTKNNAVFRAAVTDVVLDPSTQAVVDALAGAVKGEKGDAGAAGQNGAQGPAGPAQTAIREAYGPWAGQGQNSGANAQCLPGERVVGGGARFEPEGQLGEVPMSSVPDSGPPQGWGASYTVTNAPGTATGRVHVFAICAS